MISGQSLLPPVTAGNLLEIKEKLFSAHSHPSPSLRESYILLVLEKDGIFLKSLITLYADLEDLEDLEGLVKIAEICRAVLFLNDSAILVHVLADSMFVHIAGMLEYDPALKTRAEYRVFLTRFVGFSFIGLLFLFLLIGAYPSILSPVNLNAISNNPIIALFIITLSLSSFSHSISLSLSSRSRFVEVIPLTFPQSISLRQIITLLFRAKYLRDVMLRSTVEDTGIYRNLRFS
jgi:hypothetical protein